MNLNLILDEIRELQTQIEANQEQAKAKKTEIDEWLKKVNNDLENALVLRRHYLKNHMLQLRKENPELKTIKLDNGKKVTLRKPEPKWNYDEKKVLASLKELGRSNLIRIKEEIDKPKAKKFFEIKDGKAVDPETGLEVAGITVEEQEEQLVIEFGMEG